MSFNKRRIINQATEWAKMNAKGHRNQHVEDCDDIREELGLKTKEVDSLLEKPSNWYSNRYRGGSGSHEFMLQDFEFVCGFFEYIQEEGDPEDVDIEALTEYADQRAQDRLDQLEDMRQAADIDPSMINNALNKRGSWYEDCQNDDEEEMSLLSFYEVLIFLESTLMIFTDEGYLENETLSPLVEQGYIAEDVLGMVA